MWKRISGIFAVASWSLAKGAMQYTVTHLPEPPGSGADVQAISDNGLIAGVINRRPVAWLSPTADPVDLLPNEPAGQAQIVGISRSGIIIGAHQYSSSDGSEPQKVYSFLWSGGTTIQLDAGQSPNVPPEYFSVNDSAAIVGLTIDDRAIVRNGQIITDLGNPDGNIAVPVQINNHGQILFRIAEADGTERGVLRTEDIDVHVGNFGGPYTIAVGLNNLGQVVGVSDNTSGDRLPFFWQNGVMTQLPLPAGALLSFPNAINDAGTIVGYSNYSNDYIFQDGKATLWKDGQAVDLNDLIDSASGWRLDIANAINSDGVIVGVGTFNGEQEQGFILTPIPEPAPTVILVVASAALLCRRPLVHTRFTYRPYAASHAAASLG